MAGANPLAQKLGDHEERLRGLEGGLVDDINATVEAYYDTRARVRVATTASVAKSATYVGVVGSGRVGYSEVG